jgi:hypothetical protein
METTEHTAENGTHTLVENNKSDNLFLRKLKGYFLITTTMFLYEIPFSKYY